MSWGGKRTGAGRPKQNKKREVLQYRIDLELAELFSTYCFYFRTPIGATLEYILESWLSEHHEEMMAAYRELEADADAFMKRPILASNLDALKQKDIDKRVAEGMQEFTRGLRSSMEEKGKLNRAAKFQTLKGLVASACMFLCSQNKDPRQATPEEILAILDIGDKCTVKEIAKAFTELEQHGDIERIMKEQNA